MVADAILFVPQTGSQARQMALVGQALEARGVGWKAASADHLRASRDQASQAWEHLGVHAPSLPFRRVGVDRVLPGRRKFRSVAGTRAVASWLAASGCSVVVVGHDTRPSSKALLRAARRLGLRTVLLQDGLRPTPRADRSLAVRLRWMNPVLSSGDYGHGGCDRILIMSDRFAAELVAAGVPPSRVVRTGFPLYDRYHDGVLAAPADGLPDGPFALYAAQPVNLPDDVVVAHLVAVAAACRAADVALVVKGHPRDHQLSALVPRLAEVVPEVVILQDVAPEAVLQVASVLLTAFSTMSLEALLLDVPVVAMTSLPLPFRLDLGPDVAVVHREAELVAVLRRLVHDPEARAAAIAATRHLAESETHSTDGRAAERAAHAIADLIAGRGGVELSAT